MRLRAADKTKPRHRGMTPTQLKDTIRKQDCEYTKLHLHFEGLRGAYNQLRHAYHDLQTSLETERAAREAERAQAAKNLTTVTVQRDAALADVRRLTAHNTALRAQITPRDTSDPRDRSTVPMDVRQLRAELADDYLNRTRVAWTPPKPLWQAPFAMDRPPTTPTDLPGDTETTITLHTSHTAA